MAQQCAQSTFRVAQSQLRGQASAVERSPKVAESLVRDVLSTGHRMAEVHCRAPSHHCGHIFDEQDQAGSAGGESDRAEQRMLREG